MGFGRLTGFRGAANFSMGVRLFGFLVLAVATVLIFVVLVLALTGGFASGRDEAEKLMRRELSYLAQSVEKMYGETSVQTVILSQTLSKSIEGRLDDLGFTMDDLKRRPEILEGLLEDALTRLMLALEKTRCSGVFAVLDATVNPALPRSEHSKAGIYLRNSEPNVITAGSGKLYLRGFPRIATRNGLSLQSKWDMEFDVEGQSYYHKPIEAHRKDRTPLSRLYYWSYGGAVENLDEKVMLCSIPLIGSNGVAFGICGFEVSEMNFKLQFSPDAGVYSYAAFIIAPLTETGLDTSGALCSGNVPALCGSPLLVAGGAGNLHLYTHGNNIYAGLHKAIKTYPANSPFVDERNAAALFLPRADLENALSGHNNKIVLVCASALILGIALSVFISRKYVKPILEGLAILRSRENLADDFRINIPEIDELIALIKSKQASVTATKGSEHDGAGADFLQRLETLSPTERDIFDLYVKGRAANDIAAVLKISVNTVRTHSKKIYMKMDVNSRPELLSLCIGLADKLTADHRQCND